ncbi:unnamed protein product, partial [Brenthis ino]
MRFCLLALVLFQFYISCQNPNDLESKIKLPTVTIAVLVRNKAYILPYFLSALDRLDYPKNRLYLWIYSDYNSDQSIEVLREWKTFREAEYHGFYLKADELTPTLHPDEKNVSSWTPKRHRHIIRLREKALNFARRKWSDYLFMLDADVILTNPDTLKSLIWQSDSMVTGPMLESDSLYSNFWHDMSKDYTYKRTSDYQYIVTRDEEYLGCHEVPMLHSAVLVSLKHKESDYLTYDPSKVENYDGPLDDTVAFCINTIKIGSKLKLCNEKPYGYIPMPSINYSTREKDIQKLVNIKLEALSKGIVFPLDPLVSKYVTYPEPSKLTMSKIFMINLARRSERRHLMMESFKELGMDVEIYEAVDGKKLTKDDIDKLGIHMMPEYSDPFHARPMKAGEVGCFLSHYNIWKKIVENKYNLTMIMEDDVHFAPYFKEKLARVLKEAKGYKYDLLYLGRKIMLENGETRITSHTVRPLYTYWTLGYILTYRGAKKLLEANPLKNLLPVDEFLPIMFDTHPNAIWIKKFPKRQLRALSAYPLLMNPTHYTGMDGYISDTEDSIIMKNAKKKHNEL